MNETACRVLSIALLRFRVAKERPRRDRTCALLPQYYKAISALLNLTKEARHQTQAMKILVPTPLRQYAGKQAAVDVPAATVGEALNVLTSAYPDLRKHLFNEEGKLRAFVNVYLNDDDVRYLQNEQTSVKEGDTLSIIPSIAGGRS